VSPVLQTRAPVWKTLGPAATLLLSSPTTPHDTGLIVIRAAPCTTVTADEMDMITIARVRSKARPILRFDVRNRTKLNLLRFRMLPPKNQDDWFDDCFDIAIH
jgi:hypothetical protein